MRANVAFEGSKFLCSQALAVEQALFNAPSPYKAAIATKGQTLCGICSGLCIEDDHQHREPPPFSGALLRFGAFWEWVNADCNGQQVRRTGQEITGCSVQMPLASAFSSIFP